MFLPIVYEGIIVMKIGILTFHKAYNYGATLQAYALQKILVKLSKENEVEFIDYRPEYITKRYRDFNIKPFGIKILLSNLFHYFSRRKRHSKFFDFQHNFVSKVRSVKKIAYAASFSVSSLSETEKKQLSKPVNHFLCFH